MRDKILSFLTILCLCMIVASAVPVVPFEQISLDNESSPIISNPNVANHEISDYFFD